MAYFKRAEFWHRTGYQNPESVQFSVVINGKFTVVANIPLLDGVFPARAEADIADTPQIWGSPRGDDARNGPARQS